MDLDSLLTRRFWLAPALLALLVLLAYANSFPGTFVLDDIHIARNNPLVHDPDLAVIFTADYWHGFENSGLFRPVTILSLAINRLLLGESPLGFHLVNVLLHAGVTVLLWCLLRGWGVPVLAAFVGPALFAVHPLHTEAIDVVVGRSELLVALFLLAAFLFARRPGRMSGVAVCALYLLALCSKEHAITFLGLLPLVDLFFEGWDVWRRRWPLYAGLLGVAVCWLSWRYYFVVLHNPLPYFPVTEAASPIAFVDTTTRLLSALLYQGLYLGKMLVPYGLQSVYASSDLPPFVTTVFSLPGLLIVSGTCVTLAVLGLGWRRRSLPALCGVLYLVAFLPTSHLAFPIGAAFAERFCYFPSVWFCAGVAALVSLLTERSRRVSWLPFMVGGYFLCLGAVLVIRNLDYASEITLWRAEVEENPADYLGWQSLAESYNNARRFDEADAAYQVMLQLAPDYPGGLRSRTGFFLGKGLFEEALVPAGKVYALSVAKNDPIAMAFDGLDLAEIYMGLGRFAEAMTYLDGPCQLVRDTLRYLEIRAGCLSGLNRHAEAVDVFARITGEPKEHRIDFLYGKSLYLLGRLPEARARLESAVVVNDADVEAWNLLGVVCGELADWPASIAALQKATLLAPDNRPYRENLERALRGAGAGR